MTLCFNPPLPPFQTSHNFYTKCIIQQSAKQRCLHVTKRQAQQPPPPKRYDDVTFSKIVWRCPLRKKSVSGAQNNKVSEPRLFSVAINSSDTDADEVINRGFTLTYQERMLQALPQKNSLAAAITDTRIYTTESRIRR